MALHLLAGSLGSGSRVAILSLLKRSSGSPVAELARRLDMSYMAIKQHCAKLENDGLVQVRRIRQQVGRPEHLYCLTKKGQEFFPQGSSPLTLDLLQAAGELYGPTAPKKLLLRYYQQQREKWAEKIRGSTVRERAKWLARLRDNEGYLSEFFSEPEPRIEEYHHPFRDVQRSYPECEVMEKEVLEKLLGVRLRRECQDAEGVYRCVFYLA